MADRRIGLDVDQNAKEWLVNEGYSEAYGARAIARVVRTKVRGIALRIVIWSDARNRLFFRWLRNFLWAPLGKSLCAIISRTTTDTEISIGTAMLCGYAWLKAEKN